VPAASGEGSPPLTPMGRYAPRLQDRVRESQAIKVPETKIQLYATKLYKNCASEGRRTVENAEINVDSREPHCTKDKN
jgi:hypothetical protein